MSFHAHALVFQLTAYPISIDCLGWWRRRLGERKWLPWWQLRPLRPLDPAGTTATCHMMTGWTGTKCRWVHAGVIASMKTDPEILKEGEKRSSIE
jgi:hypothetical protein